MRARLRSLAPGHAVAAKRGAGGEPRRSAAGPREGRRAESETFEWRMRESDGPIDVAHYACACGFAFTAPVATAVRCPHCGAEQAW